MDVAAESATEEAEEVVVGVEETRARQSRCVGRRRIYRRRY